MADVGMWRSVEVEEGRVTVFRRARPLRWFVLAVVVMSCVGAVVSDTWYWRAMMAGVAIAAVRGFTQLGRPACIVDDDGVFGASSWRYPTGPVDLAWGDLLCPTVIVDPTDSRRPMLVGVVTDESMIRLGPLPRYEPVLAALESRLGPASPDSRRGPGG